MLSTYVGNALTNDKTSKSSHEMRVADAMHTQAERATKGEFVQEACVQATNRIIMGGGSATMKPSKRPREGRGPNANVNRVA